MKIRTSHLLILSVGWFAPSAAQTFPGGIDSSLTYTYTGRKGQVEVGGPYAGVEFHDSRPVPSRVSFYYPVANSVDVSTDYWKRGETMPMMFAVRLHGDEPRWVGRDPWVYTLRPYSVRFDRTERDVRMSVQYDFCLTAPGFLVRWTVTNVGVNDRPVELYTHLRMVLRTCQTYAKIDPTSMRFEERKRTIVAEFDDTATSNASMFVASVEGPLRSWTADARELGIGDDGTSLWTGAEPLGHRLPGRLAPSSGVAAFVYADTLVPGESMNVLQAVGSCREEETNAYAGKDVAAWRTEASMYEAHILNKTNGSTFVSGNQRLDRSAVWARALLASNAHWLDNAVVPMPCPAEYNFFFTHDLLLTNLGAVNFDHDRVKRDLLYIASHAKDGVIPHAYYWRDDGFKTEYCAPDNWNHLWFILVSGAYLRLSNDDSTAAVLYPLLTASLDSALTQRKQDDIMYAKHPDWWDIGNYEGPRSYLTILTVRAIREYCSISSRLGQRSADLSSLEATADRMQRALNDILWDEKSGYLMNSNGSDKDDHFYAGSLLGAAYGLLSPERARTLVSTAAKQLLDTNIGVRTVAPTDFHTDASIAYFRFAGLEAGKPFFYINGGVWPHTTMWYLMALQSLGRTDEAVSLLQRTMTFEGIAESPSGVPAMYEYRYADPSSPEYGTVDKPSFLWAAGKYLEVLYALFGVRNDPWNVSFVRPPDGYRSVRYSLTLGSPRIVNVVSSGQFLESLSIGDVEVPSSVIPADLPDGTEVSVRWGALQSPYLSRVDGILRGVALSRSGKSLSFEVSSFAGHKTEVEVVSPKPPRQVLLDDRVLEGVNVTVSNNEVYMLRVSYTAAKSRHRLAFNF